MTLKSKFKQPKIVLIFNGAEVLIGVMRSLHSAAQFSGGNIQAISFCCSGRYISTGGYYFRYAHPDVEVSFEDLDTLKLKEYDDLCGEIRRYHNVRDMANMRKKAYQKRKAGDQDTEGDIS